MTHLCPWSLILVSMVVRDSLALRHDRREHRTYTVEWSSEAELERCFEERFHPLVQAGVLALAGMMHARHRRISPLCPWSPTVDPQQARGYSRLKLSLHAKAVTLDILHHPRDLWCSHLDGASRE